MDFGILEPWQLGNPNYSDLIARYGPNEAGFTGITLWASTFPPETNLLNIAHGENYSPLLGQLDRGEIINQNWTAVQNRINAGAANGVTWFFVDDGLSHDIVGEIITKEQIDVVAEKVHAAGKILTTAEYNQQRMSNYPNWHQNVDIIMPYRYSYTPEQLNAFFSWVQHTYPSKGLVPFLGYKVIGAEGNSQLDAHIEIAQHYITHNLIFFIILSTSQILMNLRSIFMITTVWVNRIAVIFYKVWALTH
jgi:hypothetical protein